MSQLVAVEDGIEIGVVILDYLFGLLLLLKIVNFKKGPSKTYYTGLTGFFFAHASCRLIFLIRGIFFTGNDYLFQFGTILGLLSIILLVAATEKTLYTKSKFFFTIYGFIGIGLMIVDIFLQKSFEIGGSNYSLTMLLQYFFSPVLAAFIMILYLMAALKATGRIRTNAIFMLFAIILFTRCGVYACNNIFLAISLM